MPMYNIKKVILYPLYLTKLLETIVDPVDLESYTINSRS